MPTDCERLTARLYYIVGRRYHFRSNADETSMLLLMKWRGSSSSSSGGGSNARNVTNKQRTADDIHDDIDDIQIRHLG